MRRAYWRRLALICLIGISVILLPTTLLVASGSAPGRARTIHVFVALCDNEHQGIVPVPKELGQGDDPAHNLYWGAMYGVKTFLRKSKPYFGPRLSQLQSKSVLLTTGFMAPEAYTLEPVVAGWLAKETAEKIQERAARAYDQHQKCGLRAARRLFYSP